MFSPVTDLRTHAAARPDNVAMFTADRTWSFVELDRTVSAVAVRLRALGVAPRHLIAIDLPAADEWIITLATFLLAARSVSLSGVGDVGGVRPDVMVGAPGMRTLAAPTVITVDAGWVGQVVVEATGAGHPEAPVVLYARSDAICRIVLTSGTTGAPRAAELSVAAIEHRLANLHHYWTDERPELNFMGLSSTGGFHTALANLKHGTPYLAASVADARVFRAAAAAGIEVLAGSPVQVGRALALMSHERIVFSHLREVRMAGAAASPALVAAITETLAVPIRSVYGSTEGGGVTMRMLAVGDDPAGAGRAVHGVTLQIVDDHDSPVAAGVSGEVRYRGPGLATGYLIPDADAPFRRGWFYPGDRGSLTSDGVLMLEGRTTELVNVGGVKIDPARIDAAIDGFAGVIDAATFIIEQRPGIAELGLAVVADDSCDLRALDRMLRDTLPGSHPTVFGQVAEIPRNRMGKVERTQLTAEFRRRLNLD
jgi:acyl-coenzyme A synthetase/AMP-(fatty) acid ligase